MSYSISSIPVDALSLLLARVTENVQTTDLKIDLSSLQDDFVERMHFFEAAATVWGSASRERVKDLVLHDAGVAANAPSPDLRKAMSVLTLRRRLAASSPEDAHTDAGLTELLSTVYSSTEIKTAKPPPHPPKELLETEFYAPPVSLRASSNAALNSPLDAVAGYKRFWEWQRTLKGLEKFPPVLQTAVLLDAWHQAAILEQVPRLGIHLIASFMRRHRGHSRLRALNIGLALISRDRWTSLDPTTRLIGFLRGIEKASLVEAKEHDRLKATHDDVSSRILGRPDGALQKLVQLSRRRPAITVRIVSKELHVSEPTARSLIIELKLPEITGKKSGRVWSLT